MDLGVEFLYSSIPLLEPFFLFRLRKIFRDEMNFRYGSVIDSRGHALTIGGYSNRRIRGNPLKPVEGRPAAL